MYFAAIFAFKSFFFPASLLFPITASPPKDYQYVLRPGLLELGSKCELTGPAGRKFVLQLIKWVPSACGGVGLLVEVQQI
jgi:hypothetical protein